MLLLCFCGHWALGQVPDEQPLQTPEDTLGQRSADTAAGDSLQPSQPRDTLPPDSAAAGDTARQKGDLETTVKYSAKDSIVMHVAEQKAYMYGDAQVEYGDMELKAYYIELDWARNQVKAYAHRNDSSGKLEGIPVFKQGQKQYEAEEMLYNFNTKKALINKVVTQEGEGFIHGDTIKKINDEQVYIKGARYTTCNLPDPHYYIKADKIKAIKDDKLVTGPFNMWVADVPTPLGFFMGIFPTPEEQSSGIVVPTYGESANRGFFLRNGGYYWHISDYVDLKLLGEIYSKGSWGLQTLSNYKKRYRYRGNLQFRYNKRVTDPGTNAELIGEDYWLTWSHQPENRGSNSRFSANVSMGSQNFNRRNSFDRQNFLSNTFQSSVSFSHNFRNSPFNLNANLRQSQNTSSGVMNFTLPQLSLNMSRQFPFKYAAGGRLPEWIKKIGVSYGFNGSNEISNRGIGTASIPGVPRLHDKGNPKEDSLLPVNFPNLPDILGRSEIQGRHNIPISTAVTFLKHFTLSPSFRYTENWHTEKLSYQYREDTKSLDVDTVPGFARSYQFNANASATTRLYGFFDFEKGPLKDPYIKKMRHVMNPSLGFSYNPDFSDPIWGMYERVQIDSTGRFERLSPFQGQRGNPSNQESGSITFNLQNNLEAKVRGKNDTTGKGKKVTLLDNLNASTSYNLAADSFNLQPITIGARTRIGRWLNLNFRGTLDPYYWEVLSGDRTQPNSEEEPFRQRRVNEFAWNNGQGLGTLTRANLALSTNLNPQAFNSASEKAKEKQNRIMTQNSITQEDPILRDVINNPDEYVDFSVPWSLNISANLNFNRQGVEKPEITQSVNASGDVNLTETWKVGASTSWDFQRNEIGHTRLNIYKDLHCWQLRVNWIPFGIRQSFSVELNVKASVLQDLKLQRRRSWYDR